ncbi:MAG: serine/threonine-protein phosphatase [Phycisphaerales bacterium]|nr:serine/threonine-protein phosphatase [Phycisphaerales bacterium]
MGQAPHHSKTFTSDFRAEFDANTDQLLRRQFVWFAAITGIGGLLLCIFDITYRLAGTQLFTWIIPADKLPSASQTRQPVHISAIFFTLLFVAVHAGAMIAASKRHLTQRSIQWLTTGVVLFDAIAQIVIRKFDVQPPIGLGVWGMMWTHTLAAIFLPWSTWQAIRTVLITWAAYAALCFIRNDPAELFEKILVIMFFPFLGAPGSFIAWLIHSRRYEQHKLTFFQRRYADVRRELVDARRIHESLFPPPRPTGHLRFTYEYEPMRQIGGDYLYANWFGPAHEKDRTLSVVLMDVTGHGIPAALTVNRLHGELERVFAEDPEILPGEVLRLLNRYVHLTLATHSVFVTALCLKVDTRHNTVQYASGGHPPAFIRTVDGKIHELSSTTYVLGACGGEEFDSEQKTLRFGPGDALIAYTDGAIEARNRMGKMMGIKGVQQLVAFGNTQPHGSWCRTLRHAVESHRYGPPADDTLVVEIARGLQA